MSALAMTVSDTLVLARRNLMRIPRQPDLLVAYTVQPVMFVLLFVYVFGGAIETPGFDYVDFLMPGIIAQSIAFGGFVTALGLSEDVQKGLIDRFRSLPMSRGYAFSWVFALIGLFSSSPETANSLGFTLIFPLTFASSMFVPAESMPDGLQQFAEANPFTTITDALRSLWLGTPANTDIWMAFLWCFAFIAVFAPLAIRRYRQGSPRQRRSAAG